MTLKNYNEQSASEALKYAQLLAVSPFVFQAIVAMKQLGIFKIFSELEEGQKLTKQSIAEKCQINEYAASVLIDLAIAADIIISDSNSNLILSKTGYYLATDNMTNINLDFSNHTCYQGLFYLTESLKENRPVGLDVFTKQHKTIYPFLKELPSKAKSSWFAFDHFYSNLVFDNILKVIEENYPCKKICDIGGNTGNFAKVATDFNPNISVVLVDLPEQCDQAKIQLKGNNQVSFYPVDILDDNSKLPDGKDIDVWWMSQFLDCFNPKQVESIINKVSKTMNDNSIIVITEIFGDKQKNDTASLVIEATSLYFAAIANGCSRFYHSETMNKLMHNCNLKLTQEFSNIGLGNSVLIYKKNM